MELTLHKNKTTPGAVRFGEERDDHPVNLYLDKARVAELGNPEVIKVTIEKES